MSQYCMLLLPRHRVFYCLSCTISYNVPFNPSSFPGNFAFSKICFSSQRAIRLTRLLGASERHLKNIKVFERQCNHQAQPTWAHEGKAVTNSESFYNKITHSKDERKVVDVVFQYFSKAFGTLTASFWTSCSVVR